ncbi:hypothetical protein HBH81_172130, partial [Parastagonospora nodorum]
DGRASEGSAAEGSATEGSEGIATDGRATEGSAADGSTTEGSEGNSTEGTATDGRATEGSEESEGSATEGSARAGTDIEGAPREGAAREDAAIKGSADTSGEAIDGKISGNTAGTFDSDSRASEDIVAGSPGRVGTGSAIGSELVGTAFEGRTFDAGNPSDGNARLATLAGRLGIETGGKAMEDCTKVCKLIDGKDTGRRPESTDSTTGTTLGIIELAGDI